MMVIATSGASFEILPERFSKWYNQKCNTIKFVKSGTKFSKTNYVSKGTLHLASDCIPIAVVKSDYVFPLQLALTE